MNIFRGDLLMSGRVIPLATYERRGLLSGRGGESSWPLPYKDPQAHSQEGNERCPGKGEAFRYVGPHSRIDQPGMESVAGEPEHASTPANATECSQNKARQFTAGGC